MNQLSESLKRVVEQNPILEKFIRGLPDLGTRLDKTDFSFETKKISKSKMTLIIVTHEIEFAKKISDRIIYIKNGKIEKNHLNK